MSGKPIAARQSFGDLAPKLAESSDDVLFGDVWERTQLSKRDRSLITCAALLSLGKTEQMNLHFLRVMANDVTRDELVELTTHLAFFLDRTVGPVCLDRVGHRCRHPVWKVEPGCEGSQVSGLTKLY